MLADCAASESIRDEIRASVVRVFARAELETRDARAWHAVMRALGNRKTPQDYGLSPVEPGLRRQKALKRTPVEDAEATEER